jgi:uncharacterized protein (DUF433 family)
MAGLRERLFTPSEAAAVSGVTVKAVHNAIDKNIVLIASRVVTKGVNARLRRLSGNSLVRLKIWNDVGGALTKERRERLFADMEAASNARLVEAGDFLLVDVGKARDEIEARVRELDEANAAITSNKDVLGGEPVFAGTRIPVRAVVTMLDDGAEEAEILDGYPKLTRRLLALARIWVAANPARGRPKTLGERGFALKSSQKVKLPGAMVAKGL